MSLAAHALGAYDPRARHLTGLGAHDPRQRYLSAYDPRARHLTGLSLRALGLRGADIRTLRGLGCARCVSALGQDIPDQPDIGPDYGSPMPVDTGPAPVIVEPTGGISLPPGIISSAQGPTSPYGATPPPPAGYAYPPSTSAPVVSAAGSAPSIFNPAPSSIALPAGIISAQQQTALTNPPSPAGTIFGVPTQYLMYGALGIMALSVLGSGKKGRRR